MYSLVLMTALAPGAGMDSVPVATAPVVIGCAGCAGCAGVVGYGSCTGCYGSCYGSCHGFGGGLFGKHKGGGLFGHRHACHGCGGCAGYSCAGWNCFGSGFGTVQSTPWQCHGGCHGGYYGFGSVYGPPYGMPPYALYPYGTPAVYGTITNTNPPTMNVPPEKKEEGMKDGEKKEMGASIKFRLPADARLYVDGRLTTLTGTERLFSTPPLAPGRYFYDVKAVVLVDGKPVTEEKRVIVEPGAELTESFPTLFAAVGRRGDGVAGK